MFIRFIVAFSVALICVGCASDVSYKNKTRAYTIAGEKYQPLNSANDYSETGVASWYGGRFHGRKTASGERYNQNKMTAAHKTLPFGTRVRVKNLNNGKSVSVVINDRGPFTKGRIIDVSRAAARKLDMINSGTARVQISTEN